MGEPVFHWKNSPIRQDGNVLKLTNKSLTNFLRASVHTERVLVPLRKISSNIAIAIQLNLEA